MRPLAQHLATSAIEFVRSSLRAHGDGRSRPFLLEAGTALEHLLKAALAERNPVLIADRRRVAGLGWFVDEKKHTIEPPLKLRTIGIGECIDIAIEVGVPITDRSPADRFADHRNGVAHLGIGGMDEADALLPGYLTLLTTLAVDLGISLDALFGEFREFATTQIAEHQAEVHRVLAGRVAQAQVRFKELYGSYDDKAVANLREMAERATRTRASPDEQVVACPACDMPALGHGEVVIAAWEPDYDNDGNVWNAYPALEYRPNELQCGVCHLHLDTTDLVLASKVFDTWEVSDEDYTEIMESYYDDLRADEEYQRRRDYGY